MAWSHMDYSPLWETEEIPEEVSDAVESGWFQPGARVLDIGCGTGLVAAWMADRGFCVTGVDFTETAIERARARHTETSANLEFEVADICGDTAPGSGFNALVDRGCFHGIPKALRKHYVRNVVTCSTEGARFLLFARTRLPSQQERDRARLKAPSRFNFPAFDTPITPTLRSIELAFGPIFRISKVAETYIGVVPAVAVWMIRSENL